MTKPMPLVSVMMPAYNAGRYLGGAIQSVLGQTYRELELIVVDDGSTDETPEIVSRFQDARVVYVRQENQGEAGARNTALEHVRGEYLAFLDADDEHLPDHISRTVEYLERFRERDAVYTDGYYIDREGRRLGALSENRRGPFEGRIFDEVVRASDVFGPPICVVLRTELVKQAGLRFDTRIVIGPDWDFLVRVADLAQFGYLEDKTCLYRLHETNISVQVERERRYGYLRLCRENAIQMPSFAACAEDVKAAVFYDLMVELSDGQYDRRLDITRRPPFKGLAPSTRAWLFRMIAGKAILDGAEDRIVQHCLEMSRTLLPSDWKGRLLTTAYRLHPGISKALLRIKRSRQEVGARASAGRS
ncbi:MAG: glycosyltransferase family 2 protein [Acidobacteriota bacterium]